MIDPVLDYDPGPSRTWTESVDQVSAFLKEHDLALRYVLETHAHADHLSASQLLKRRHDAAGSTSRAARSGRIDRR